MTSILIGFIIDNGNPIYIDKGGETMKTNEILKHFLKERGVKQYEVAKGIGVKNTTFNAMLNGHAELKATTLEAVCQYIGVSPSFFYRYRFQANGKKAPA